METMYDIAIVGSGPAGLSAAINAKIRNKNVIIFGHKDLSSKLTKAPKVNNYLGFYGITGIDLKNNFENHIKAMDLKITEERINSIYDMGDYYALMVNEKMYQAKSVIIATGIEYTKPFKGEEEFVGRGVGYCATCDAPLYKDKTVAVIGYNKDGEEESSYVAELVSKLYYIPMYEGEYDIKGENVEIIKAKPLEVKGDNLVNTLSLSSGDIKVDGVFVLRESISPAQLVPGLEIEDGHIKVNRLMKTNLNGCFAAGDCIGRPYQYIKASGEGLVAALSAVSYLDKVGEK